MNIVSVSWNNLRARPMASFLSLLLLTLGVSIISLLLLLNAQLEDNFNKNVRGISMVLGAKGSPLQLILASVYHIDNPTGNIPLAEVKKAMNNPLVEKWIPLAYGDNFKGYRILGTDHQYVDHYGASLAEGVLWENVFEVTPGALAAERLGLKVGDEFLGAHGVVGEINIHEGHAYKVSGILKPTGTVIDQLILTNIASVWEIHEEHDENAPNESTTEESGDITAALVKFRTPMGMMQIPKKINEETSMQAALPAIEISRLFDLFAAGIQTIRAIALAIIVISGISVFFSLYSSLKDRKYELALMRTLGASRWQLFAFVMQEGLILALLGFVLGIGISRGGMLLFSLLVESEYRYRFDIGHFLPEEGFLFGITLLIGFFAALIPGIQAFNTNISETLADG